MRNQIIGLVLGLIPVLVEANEACSDGSGPQEAVGKYLSAMQDHRFKDAFDFVTSNMTDGKPRDEWAALQKLFYEGGEVNIFGIDVRKALVDDKDATCKARAIVPNVLKSRDRFNNQGIAEFELYVTIRDGDVWQIDSQETLFEQPEVDQWFPGEKMPEFRDKY
jgi:hypothetical protein